MSGKAPTRGEPDNAITTRGLVVGFAAVAIATCFMLTTSARAQTPVTAADDWQSAAVLPPNVNWDQSNAGFTSAGEPLSTGSTAFCPSGAGGTVQARMESTFWHRITGTGGPIRVSTFLSNPATFDTLIAVYAANQTPSDTSATGGFCNDDAAAGAVYSELGFPSAAGATYYVQWGGCVVAASTPCQAGLSWTGNLNHTVLTNDNRAYPAEPANNENRTNVGSTTDPGEVTDCRGVPYGSTVWFRWRAPAQGSVTFRATRFQTVSALYRGSGTTPIDCNDVAGNDPFSSQVSAPVAAGEELLWQVGGNAEGGGFLQGNFSSTVSFIPDSDIDKDGVPVPADCNDNNPAIKPGAVDTPENGVDEDCSGADAINLDRDRDGIPRPRDCNDNNPRIRPGARDVPGNRIDEDCNGRDARFRRVGADIKFTWALRDTSARFRIRVTSIPAGARVEIRCRGDRKCPRKITRRYARARSRVEVWKRYRGLHLRVGASVEVRVTARNRVGIYERRVVRPNRREPREISGCVAPNSRRKVKC